MAAIAADPELLARVRTDLAQVILPLAAEAAALRDALAALRRAHMWSGPWPAPPGLPLPAPPLSPAPPVPPAVEQVVDEVARSARHLVELLARSEQRFRAADRARRLGAPLVRVAPPARAPIRRRPALRPPHLARAAPRRERPGLPAARRRPPGRRTRSRVELVGGRHLAGAAGRRRGSPGSSPPTLRGAPGWSRRSPRSAPCSPTGAGSPSARSRSWVRRRRWP